MLTQTVGKYVSSIRDALDLVMGLSQLIRFSPKQSHLFQSMQSQMSPGAQSLKPLCLTCWTVRTAEINPFFNNYAVLLDVLIEINREGNDKYTAKAGGYLNKMDVLYVYFGLKLSLFLISATEQLSITLQGKDTSIEEAI